MKVSPLVASLVVVTFLFPVSLFGAGFQVPEQGVASMGMGMAFIGKADDLSAIYHNPAGLAQLPGMHVYGDVAGISAPATYTRPGFDGQDNKADLIPVPLLAFSTDFGGRLKNMVLALAMNTPYGLRNSYDDDGPQRYMTTEISLTTLYIGPYFGWQITPAIAVGGGLQYVYASANIGQRVNYGGSLNPALNENPAYDGALDVEDVTDNGFSANAGVLVKPMDSLQIGITWRSGIELDLSGTAKLTIPPIVSQLSGGLIQSIEVDGASTVSLPQNVGIGVAFQPIEPLTLVGDVTWINWEVYENLDFDFSPDVAYLPDTLGPRKWDDTIAIRGGAEYWLTEKYAVRAGYLYDQSPIPDNTLGPELPSGDRHGITLGFGMQWEQLSVDLAYAHLFIEERTVTETLRDSLPLGEYETSANIFGVSVGYAF